MIVKGLNLLFEANENEFIIIIKDLLYVFINVFLKITVRGSLKKVN